MLPRHSWVRRVGRALRQVPVALLLGPRQCGKTTLAGMVAREAGAHARFDLEEPADLMALAEPMAVLEPLRGLVILDEVQRRPDLFPVIRVLSDRKPVRTRFLILGSTSPALLRQSSESLAGRVEIIEMGGFDLGEVGAGQMRRLWMRGSFPRSFTAGSLEASRTWRRDLTRAFVERDVPQLGFRIPAVALRRFWTMLAHYHGETWNASEIGRSLGVSDMTTRRWLDLLDGAYLVRQLQPWFENIAKRQVKAPKIYIRDSGLLHSLLGIRDLRDLASHPKCGASWEGFALEQVLALLRPEEAWTWGVHGQAELDLLVVHRGRRLGFEFKFADAPTLTRSLTTAKRELRLAGLFIIYPGRRRYGLPGGALVLPLSEVERELGGGPRSRGARSG